MKLEDIKTIGVVGGGVMGGGITQTAIMAGYKVIVRDLTDEILEKTKNTIIDGRFGLKGGVERGKQTQEQLDQAVANLSLTTKVEDLKDCDLIIEAIGGGDDGAIENKPLKLKVFAELDKIVKKDAIFASNSSTYTIADLNKVVERKDRFIGMHWFSPANIMKLVELIYTPDTLEEVIQTLEGLCQRFGKTSIRVKDVPGDTGFVCNRIYHAARDEALKIVEQGIATEEDVDIAMKLGRNWPSGPFESLRSSRQGWS
ncbi:3-hydroxyacyl-CoA dehydrogenase family protein [Chloroflexota bacterium]